MQEDEINENINENVIELQKPPPICMDDIENFPLMLESFITVQTGEVSSWKSVNSIKGNANTPDAYRKLPKSK